MPKRWKSLTLALVAVVLLGAETAHARLPRDFFGLAPQTPLGAADT